jgi:hypothetical protein
VLLSEHLELMRIRPGCQVNPSSNIVALISLVMEVSDALHVLPWGGLVAGHELIVTGQDLINAARFSDRLAQPLVELALISRDFAGVRIYPPGAVAALLGTQELVFVRHSYKVSFLWV